MHKPHLRLVEPSNSNSSSGLHVKRPVDIKDLLDPDTELGPVRRQNLLDTKSSELRETLAHQVVL